MVKLETIDEIIDFAIAREEHAYELYKSMAKREVYSNAARLCERLAENELEHKKKLQQHFMKQDQLDSPIDISDHVIHNNQKMVFMDFQEFLNFAAKKEEIAFKLYKEMATRSTNSRCREVFFTLAREEEKHKEALMQELKDLLK